MENFPREIRDDWVFAAGTCARGRGNRVGTGLCGVAGISESATRLENNGGRFSRASRSVAFVRRTWWLATRAKGEAHPGGTCLSRIGFRSARENTERRLGHARAFGTPARA